MATPAEQPPLYLPEGMEEERRVEERKVEERSEGMKARGVIWNQLGAMPLFYFPLQRERNACMLALCYTELMSWRGGGRGGWRGVAQIRAAHFSS